MSQLGSNRGGEAVSELRRVSQNLDAVVVGVARSLGVEVAHQLRRAEDVEERLRLAKGETGKLNEGPLGDKGRRVSIVEHRADADIGTDRSVRYGVNKTINVSSVPQHKSRFSRTVTQKQQMDFAPGY